MNHKLLVLLYYTSGYIRRQRSIKFKRFQSWLNCQIIPADNIRALLMIGRKLLKRSLSQARFAPPAFQIIYRYISIVMTARDWACDARGVTNTCASVSYVDLWPRSKSWLAKISRWPVTSKSLEWLTFDFSAAFKSFDLHLFVREFAVFIRAYIL